MRTYLLGLFTLAVITCHAQEGTPLTVPEKAVVKLEKMRNQTQGEVVLGKRNSLLPPETRPMLNRILVQSANDFLSITTHKPTKEAYYKSVDAGLTRIKALVTKLEDRQQVAEYYQDLLDIVGIDSSEGRLMAFVEESQPTRSGDK